MIFFERTCVVFWWANLIRDKDAFMHLIKFFERICVDEDAYMMNIHLSRAQVYLGLLIEVLK